MPGTGRAHNRRVDERKQAEVEYPERIGEAGREWLRTKPFANEPRETARHLIDAGYVIDLLDLRAGQRFVELGCGPGWMTRFMARHGLDAHGYDISPAMIEIAGWLIANGSASSLTVASPEASRARIARRVGSASAAKVASSVAVASITSR